MLAAGVRRVHHIGLARDRVLFEGLPVTPVSVDAAEEIVCTGYPDRDDDLDATLEAALRRGQRLLCTNPDTSLTVGATRLRFAGLVAERYRSLGGHVVETGKPGALIYRGALDKAASVRGRPVAPAQVLGIGDTVALDVAGALGNGFARAPDRSCAAPADGRVRPAIPDACACLVTACPTRSVPDHDTRGLIDGYAPGSSHQPRPRRRVRLQA